MKNTKLIIKSVLLISLIVGLVVMVTRWDSTKPTTKPLIKLSDKNSEKMYTETLTNLISENSNFSPKNKNNTSTQPEIAGEAGIIVELDSGDILFEKDSKTKRPIASLVKIMTAVIALEHKGLNENIYVTRETSYVGENSMGLTENEIYSLEELLYGLVMHSGNDAAYAIAEGVAGDSDIFVEWMNFKAKELGLKNTYFADPSGLDNDSYSTPEDLVKLTNYALKSETFKEIVSTVEHEIYYDENNKYIYLYNQTNLLTTYPGVAGVKTGYTEEAGLCLVTYAENEGKKLVGVVLNSIDRKGDMILMLDHSFSTLGIDIKHNLLW